MCGLNQVAVESGSWGVVLSGIVDDSISSICVYQVFVYQLFPTASDPSAMDEVEVPWTASATYYSTEKSFLASG
jgi:hypothetical protein